MGQSPMLPDDPKLTSSSASHDAVSLFRRNYTIDTSHQTLDRSIRFWAIIKIFAPLEHATGKAIAHDAITPLISLLVLMRLVL
jgi:hypothetical protein